ncbi:MAG: hypothetical protein R3C11_17160 [Planctomycetaceae bacterium]
MNSLETWVGTDGNTYHQEATAVFFAGEASPPLEFTVPSGKGKGIC